MNDQQLTELIETAIKHEILPHDASLEPEMPAWPIVLMTGLGAWLAVIPFSALIFLSFRDMLLEGALCYVLGTALLTATTIILRKPSVPLFFEQLCIPAMLLGGMLLAFALYRDMPHLPAGALLTLTIIGTAWLIPLTWLRSMLGTLACLAFIIWVTDERQYLLIQAVWPSTQIALFVWLIAAIFPEISPTSAQEADYTLAVEAISDGWILFALLVLAFVSGPTFLVSAPLGQWAGIDIASIFDHPMRKALSLALTFAGIAWISKQWQALRAPSLLPAAAMLMVFSWLMPSLGAAVLVIAVCVTSGRWRIAVAGAITAAWIIGAFYYQFMLPLAIKGIIMTCVGMVLAVAAWLNWRTQPHIASSEYSVTGRGTHWQQAGIAASLVTALGVANGAIWQKEQLISTGRPIFLELAPVDPRSLMQGDYMAWTLICGLSTEPPSAPRAESKSWQKSTRAASQRSKAWTATNY